MTLRKRFEVEGRVQGVGFRAWTIRQARTLGLQGTVRNRSDGCVEVDAAGSQSAIARLSQLLGEGPAFAHVTSVRELEPGSDPLPEGFHVAW